MGVPNLYRWLSERYPLINRPVNKLPMPEIDNFYLDANGILHTCTHGDNAEVKGGSEEEQLIAICSTIDSMVQLVRPKRLLYIAITDYLERVFNAVRPRKLLFMAVDGVAPRAKMNQQRSRRFRSAQEAQEKEEVEAKLREEWAREGREVPPPASGRPFDSNVITPGTPFMERLADYLRAFTHMKLSSDPGWRGIKVVLSDGSVPGEG